jgi:diguanylate cyclase (GGDEF)-like protein
LLERTDRRRDDGDVAVLYVDLDEFKSVNDRHGHAAGDAVLSESARRMTDVIRDGDVVARLGGDEFGVLLAELAEEEDAVRVAKRLLNALERSIWLRQQPVHVGASIGIAIFPRDGQTYEEVMKHADIAMYRAKAEQVGLQFYRPELSIHTRERLLLEDELRRGIEEGKLSLHFQPIYHLREHRVVGAEALTRWPHHRRDDVAPPEFIPIAEETGLIAAIDRLAVVGAVRMAGEWSDGGWDGWVSANLSARSLAEPGMSRFVGDLLAERALDPARIAVEITESAAMRNPAGTAEILNQLRDIGVQIALDDFGMGYSSLAYLKRFPVDILKLDKHFVRGIGVDAKDERMIEGVIALAHGLGIQVLAEGVEEEQQLDWLVDQGCDMIQGFLIGAPVAADAVADVIRGGARFGSRLGDVPAAVPPGSRDPDG